jgi:hypothetical protein
MNGTPKSRRSCHGRCVALSERTRRYAVAFLAVLVSASAGSYPSAAVDVSRGAVKAVYLSYYGVGAEAVRERIANLLEHTELNGVVIDVKGDDGLIPYDTRVPLAIEAGARGRVRPTDFDAFVSRLKAKGVYTIARIVVFKDTVLTRHRPAWAVRDARTGGGWHDREGSWHSGLPQSGRTSL